MIKGDTVRLKVHFKSLDGVPVIPEIVKLTIYKKDKSQLEQFILTDDNSLGNGVFYYDYLPADELDEFIFEFAGSVKNNPIVARDRVQIKFY